jgi:hypothetical protein
MRRHRVVGGAERAARALALLVFLTELAGSAGVARADGLRIEKGAGGVTVSTGPYEWQLSSTAFDVVHAASVGGKVRLGPGRASVEALGGKVVFGPPSEVKTGADWVELRGWAREDKHLWYVARYQFWAGKPYARLVLTLTDRHDRSPGEQSDKYWKNRTLAHWRLEVGAPDGHPSQVTQHNSYSYSSPGGPWIEVVSKSGAPYQWTRNVSDYTPRDSFELVHAAGDPANQIVWHPGVTGPVELTALVKPFQSGAAYQNCGGASYEIVDAAGKVHAVAGDQTKEVIPLGRFTLGTGSIVRLKAMSSAPNKSGNVLAGPLRVVPQSGMPGAAFEIAPGARHDGVLHDGPLTIALKDFWQHHPVTLFRTEKTIGWQAIEAPEEYTGGMGLTLETMLAIDGPPAAARAALYAPPERKLPPGWSAVDGSLGANARYDALVKLFAERLTPSLESLDDFGWRNWGDYQIGTSYTLNGENVEDWGNLQYDLPLGALMAWMRTGDPALWDFAQASVRHLMDIDLVKFSPFEDKINGLVYRKGEMPRRRSHIAAEPIVSESFAYRSLLLYAHLTGEEWPRDLAKQLIDRLCYYVRTRPQFVLWGGRDTSWMLRGPLAGAAEFGQRGSQPYQDVADTVVKQLVDYYQANGRLPGKQPVWQGQILEGLAIYNQRTPRPEVARIIVDYSRKLLTDSLRQAPDGQYEFMYCFPNAGKDCGDVWSKDENYLYLWLGGISAAARISHDPFFSRWADKLFTYGEAKMRDRRDIRAWTAALAFPSLYLEPR